jgi:hypothetical protein
MSVAEILQFLYGQKAKLEQAIAEEFFTLQPRCCRILRRSSLLFVARSF